MDGIGGQNLRMMRKIIKYWWFITRNFIKENDPVKVGKRIAIARNILDCEDKK